MSEVERLRSIIPDVLATEVKAYDLPGVCTGFGLDEGEESEAFSSKRTYVRRRIAGLRAEEVVELGKRAYERFPNPDLGEVLHLVAEEGSAVLTELTRRKAIGVLGDTHPLSGRLDLLDFLGRIFPLRQYHSTSMVFGTLEDEIAQHMVFNDDWDFDHLSSRLNLLGCSEYRFVKLLELSVHPMVRDGEAQHALVEALNDVLKPDGRALAPVEVVSGESVFKVVTQATGVSGHAKNLIFAADGPKPEIVFQDAINNDVQIVRNEKHILVYDRPLGPAGLRWGELVDWWADLAGGTPRSRDAEESLYRRLVASLGSEPEKRLFRSYYEWYQPALGWELPVLIPQVYLHYDPYTARMRRDMKVLPRQRMDFLLLFSPQERVVLEVDGKQHYSESGRPSPKRYGEMVAADRELRMVGYEVYRFGGYELLAANWDDVLRSFFDGLLLRHGVAQRSV